ncbi:hypothetical protein M011DRAFT_501700 [Sporormia fimetaria CBS 119925]|uniref:Uncharacterized protein n=1 Tax=Sporormia fimetaria CBS 119925 TaxID=1340428 RepID=A0A6A6VA87_9PLEO|nr:hypothetical protein M011DRAFT_501700 [Sporormia fimetaria CBS 119925]
MPKRSHLAKMAAKKRAQEEAALQAEMALAVDFANQQLDTQHLDSQVPDSELIESTTATTEPTSDPTNPSLPPPPPSTPDSDSTTPTTPSPEPEPQQHQVLLSKLAPPSRRRMAQGPEVHVFHLGVLVGKVPRRWFVAASSNAEELIDGATNNIHLFDEVEGEIIEAIIKWLNDMTVARRYVPLKTLQAGCTSAQQFMEAVEILGLERQL